MDILNDKLKDNLDKEQLEYLQKKKHEYKLIGSYTRTPGMSLFCYKHSTGKIEQINIVCSGTAKLIPDGQGGLTWCDAEHSSVMVDSHDTFFEALNMRNAVRRVERFKAGQIKYLCNLTVRTGSISIF